MNEGADHSSDEELEEGSWQEELTTFRLHLVERIVYERMCPALQSLNVIDQEDDEEIRNRHINLTEKQRINFLLNVLMRKGAQNYKRFLVVLGKYYPDIYKDMTGKEADATETAQFNDIGADLELDPSQISLMLIDALKENEKLKGRIRKNVAVMEEKGRSSESLKAKNEELTQRVQRYENVDSEIGTLRQEVDRLKTENYKICMQAYEAAGENSKLREINIKSKDEFDKLNLELVTMRNSVDFEQRHSVRLRRKLQDGPTATDLLKKDREIDLLKLKLFNINNEKNNDDVDMRIQIMQKDKEEAIEVYGEALENINKLRVDCAETERLRDKYLEEKEQLELTVSVLRSDIDMHRIRKDSVWQQYQEVEKEKKMLLKERNEAQMFAKDCMQEKACYRTQIRELEEKYDEVKENLLQCEKEIIRLKSATPYKDLSELDWKDGDSIRSSSLTSTTSTCSKAPTIPDIELPPHEEEELGVRERAYVTKYYKKYASKNLGNDELYISGDGSILFPMISLSSDYPSNNKLVRRRQVRKQRTCNLYEMDTTETSSTNAVEETTSG